MITPPPVNQEGALCVRDSVLMQLIEGQWQQYPGPPMVISPEKFESIVSLVTVPGPIAEVGVAAGGVVWALAKRFPDRLIYAYDTFDGLPGCMWTPNEIHKPGEFVFPGTKWILETLPNVRVRSGLFPETIGGDPDRPRSSNGFAAVHLDCDFYLSTRMALGALVPRMAPGGVIILDDWDWPACPGVRQAVEDHHLKAVPTGVPNQACVWLK